VNEFPYLLKLTKISHEIDAQIPVANRAVPAFLSFQPVQYDVKEKFSNYRA
jgi:hypothetical protein